MLKNTERLPMTVEKINVMTARARALPPEPDQTYVLIEDGEDPWVIKHGSLYYYCTVDRSKKKIMLASFDKISELSTATLKEVWPLHDTEIPDYIEIWAPELQVIDGLPYIHFALYHGNALSGEGAQERVHSVASITHDLFGPYRYQGKINVLTDRWAIDGTVANIYDKKYFVWSGLEANDNHSQNIYIAEMKDAISVSSDRVCLSMPEFDWEMQGYPYINEGPQALYHDENIFIVYAASGSWTDHYCLGMLTYLGGDPLRISSWQKEKSPVFKSANGIFAPGHCCFVKDEEDQDIIIYHTARRSGGGWARQIRWKPFTWNPDGKPDFGVPL